MRNQRNIIANSVRPVCATMSVVLMAVGLLQWVHGAPVLGRNLFLAGGGLLAVIILFWVVGLWRNQQHNWRVIVLAIFLGIVPIGMVGFSYGMVPMFDWIVRVLEIKGTVKQAEPLHAAVIDHSCLVGVQVITTNHAYMPWTFKATPSHFDIAPGQAFKVQFSAHNPTHHDMVAKLVLSVSPSKAASYVNITHNVTDQPHVLALGHSANYAVDFQVAADLPKSIRQITLAYTLLDVTDR